MASNPPRPTQKAFVPIDRSQIRSGFGIGLFCLVIALFGMGVWLLGSRGFSLLGATDRNNSSDLMIIVLASPLMLLASFYFLYTTGRDWRQSTRFQSDKQSISGTISHLWAEPSSKVYYAGFQYMEYQAYQEISRKSFNSLKVGDSISVDYLPQNPQVTRLIEAEKSASTRKKSASK